MDTVISFHYCCWCYCSFSSTALSIFAVTETVFPSKCYQTMPDDDDDDAVCSINQIIQYHRQKLK